MTAADRKAFAESLMAQSVAATSVTDAHWYELMAFAVLNERWPEK